MNDTKAHPLAAAHYADRAVALEATIVEHRQIARDTFLLRFYAPTIAARIRPGQFLMLRLAGFDDPMLGRALALFDVEAPRETAESSAQAPKHVAVVYMVVGKLTSRLRTFQPGQTLKVWGPLGNGFSPAPVDHLVMVAGGVGITPFLAVAQQALGLRGYGGDAPQRTADRVTLCYGARTADYLAAVEQFTTAGVDVRVATDDGSQGIHGRVTAALGDVLREHSARAGDPAALRVLCCGPEPRMEAAVEVCRRTEASCFVSLETPMACGIGICFSCVAKVLQNDGAWDYKRTCVEGPVFDAGKIVW
jgi:dihydroorotate dehydrogenase electron transfer subunit